MKNLKLDLSQNNIICGDCKDWLPYIPSNSVDLIYIDPPFFSNKTYEIVWGNGFELRSFGDRWKGGINHYIGWMRDKIIEAHRILKPTGSIFLHCDHHANHHLRFLLDDIFLEKNFLNELIWFYQTGGASKKHFSKKHDNIYWYSKSKKYNFYPERIKEKRTEKSLKRAMNPKGARIQVTDLYKYPNDVLQIQALNPMEKERIGYRTQKPEALLKKLINACSDKSSIILDFFGGGARLQRLPMTWAAAS